MSTPATTVDGEWQRLDPRMMLVHPIRELIRFLPVLVGLFVASASTDGNNWFQLVGVAVPIALGLVRYWTTRYRIHADRVELRRGLLSTHLTSAPLDRVRTVDLTASPIHRILGLATVRIGTGTAAKQGDDGLDLDGLPADGARELRHRLLHSIAPAPEVPGAADGTGPITGERLVARFEPGWLRFAPFTSAGFLALAAVIGGGFQLLDGLGAFSNLEDDPAGIELGAGSAATLAGLALAVAALVAVFAVVGYLLANGNFALSHTLPDGSWHVRRGVLTTRETSVDDDRLRGVSIGEPLGLRLVHGGRLNAIATGLDRSQSNSSALLPPTPRDVVDRVAAEVVGTPDPVRAPLVDHGPRARTRRYVRALVPASVLAVAPVVLAVVLWPVWWALAVLVVLVGLGLGHDRAGALGHALVGGWLVARSGSLTRARELLATDAVIGWNLSSTWFQRRAGLVTLVATTAGGRQSVTIPDVPVSRAVELADEAVPGLLADFAN